MIVSASCCAISAIIILSFSVPVENVVALVFQLDLFSSVVLVHVFVLLVHTAVAFLPVLHQAAPQLDDHDDDDG